MLDGRVDAFARHSISGWAADADRPDARVEVAVLVDGRVQGHARADRPREDLQMVATLGDGAHGFAYAFDPPLSPLRSYDIAVCHAGTEEPLRLGRFTITAEVSHPAERMRPIVVSVAGRSGGVELMRSLAGHAGIVAADSHDYGVRLMRYYARALEVLVVPGPRTEANTAADGDDAAYVLESNPFHTPDYERLLTPPRLLYEFFQNQSATPICAAFKSVVTQFYETLAMHQGKRMAGYFAEQCDLFDVARSFSRMAFQDAREIVLVQDPRDAYCAYRTLWFTTSAQVVATLRRGCDRAAALRRERRPDTLFVRYEDLRSRPEAALVELARFLSLDHALAADPQMLRAAAEDATLHGVGQWRTELDSTEVALLEREFADYLGLFGYELSARAAA